MNRQTVTEPEASSSSENAAEPDVRPEPLRSVHTTNLPAILDQLGASILVTTYQAGKLVMLRPDGGVLNTHFRRFKKPMGLARRATGSRLARPVRSGNITMSRRSPAGWSPPVGTTPASCRAFSIAPATSRFTRWPGAGDRLWFVNTRFSCLCTLDRVHSFVPRWRPSFITDLAPEDRCHLNGLCLIDGHPAAVTALGETDSPGGWRANKPDGGVLIEPATGRVLLRGLSMPHSPRWHNGRLWVLRSGPGSLGFLDPRTGIRRVAVLPGFTRGLDFLGDLAFVGLSQVREGPSSADTDRRAHRSRTALRRLGGRRDHRRECGLRPVRRRRARDLRRAGPRRRPLPRPAR